MIQSFGLCRCLGDRPSRCRSEDRKRKAHLRDKPGLNNSKRLPALTDYRGHQNPLQSHLGSGRTVQVPRVEGRI